MEIESPGAIIERKVLGFYRQHADQRFNYSATHNARKLGVSFGQAVTAIHRITGEKLIAAVAAQRNGHVLAREARQQICRHE